MGKEKRFTYKVKDAIARKIGIACQICGKIVHNGQYAHIIANSQSKGPRNRNDPNIKIPEKYNIEGSENGLYLCMNCHNKIDSSPMDYTFKYLRSIQKVTPIQLNFNTTINNLLENVEHLHEDDKNEQYYEQMKDIIRCFLRGIVKDRLTMIDITVNQWLEMIIEYTKNISDDINIGKFNDECDIEFKNTIKYIIDSEVRLQKIIAMQIYEKSLLHVIIKYCTSLIYLYQIIKYRNGKINRDESKDIYMISWDDIPNEIIDILINISDHIKDENDKKIYVFYVCNNLVQVEWTLNTTINIPIEYEPTHFQTYLQIFNFKSIRCHLIGLFNMFLRFDVFDDKYHKIDYFYMTSLTVNKNNNESHVYLHCYKFIKLFLKKYFLEHMSITNI